MKRKKAQNPTTLRYFKFLDRRTNNRYIDGIADLISQPDPNINELNRKIIKRNDWIQKILKRKKKKPSSPTQEEYDNFSTPLTSKTDIPQKFQAFHSGPPGQTELRSSELGFENNTTTNHVYFSLSLVEVARDYLLPERSRTNGIYVADLRKAKNSRVQTSYSGETLWCDEIRTLIDCYRNPDFMDSLLKDKRCLDSAYIEPFKHRSKEELHGAIHSKISGWLGKYTIPFKIKDLDEYKKKNQTHILIPQPIKIIKSP